MTLITYEGVVQKGSILLSEGIQLPENAKVYIVVTEDVIPVEINGKKPIQVLSPNLAVKEEAARFDVTITEEKPNE